MKMMQVKTTEEIGSGKNKSLQTWKIFKNIRRSTTIIENLCEIPILEINVQYED